MLTKLIAFLRSAFNSIIARDRSVVAYLEQELDKTSEAEKMVLSILSTIVVDAKRFFAGSGTYAEKFAVSMWKLFKKAPTAIQTVDNFVTSAAPEIVAAVALVDPIADPEVAAALAVVETGLGAIDAAATAATTGNSLLVNLQNFASTVPALLTGLAIKNPELQAQVIKIVNLVNAEAKVLIPAVTSWVAQIKTATPVA